MDRNRWRTWRFAALWGVLVLSAGCQDQITDPESFQVEPQDALVHATPSRAHPMAAAAAHLAALDINTRFRTIAVPYPSTLEVGTCYTQVTTRARPVPFTMDHITFEAPQAALDEADGASVLLEYRFRDSSGRIIEAARCRVPNSQVAIDQVFGQFAEHGLGARVSRPGASHTWGGTPVTGGLMVSGDPVPASLEHIVAAMDGGPGGECDANPDPEYDCHVLDGVYNGGGDGEQCASWHQEWDEDLLECNCANGSPEWDCWIDPDEPEDPYGTDPEDDLPGGGGSNPPPPDDDDEEEECRPHANPDCVHRYINDEDAWSPADSLALHNTIERVTANGCHDIANKLTTMRTAGMFGMWDARIKPAVAAAPVWGRYAGSAPGEVYHEFILVWSGKGRQASDGWNIYRTFVHEALHALGYRYHTDIDFPARESECLGDMYSPKGAVANHDIPYMPT